jgi:hypothetical protein
MFVRIIKVCADDTLSRLSNELYNLGICYKVSSSSQRFYPNQGSIFCIFCIFFIFFIFFCFS